MEKVLFFWQKPWSNPFKKMQILAYFKAMFFTVKLSLLLFLNFSELFLLIYFALKQ